MIRDNIDNVKDYRIGYTVGNAEEHKTEYFEELFTESEAKKRVEAMRAIDARPGLRGARIDSNYFYERLPSASQSDSGQQ